MRLQSTGQGDGAIVVPSIPSAVETGFGPIRFAIGPNGQPRLMVPCGPGVSLGEVTSSSNLSVSLSRYDLGGRSSLFIDVMCNERALDSVFAELADEIVHRIAGGLGPVDAVEGTIRDFRNLLHDAESQEVTTQQIVGLIGELVVLRSLARLSSKALEAWVGPHEQRHDFRRREHAIEVKTTARADATSVTISSVEQLSEPVGGTLALVHVSIERADGGRLSVSDLCTEIIANGVARHDLWKALALMGCLDAAAPEWNRIRYELNGVTGYQVTDKFPRITPLEFSNNTLPEGIESVVYSIDLRSATNCRLRTDELEATYARLVT